jgi:hypothetical protein
VYQGRNGGLWAVSGNETQYISGPVRDLPSTGDLTYLEAPAETAALANVGAHEGSSALIHGTALRYLDVAQGQWGRWDIVTSIGSQPVSHTGVNGRLWGLLANGKIYSFDSTDNLDDGVGFQLQLTTADHRVAGPSTGWGRLRKVILIGRNPATDVNVEVLGYADGSVLFTGPIVNGATGWVAQTADGLWPRATGPEFWADVQRCSTVRFVVTVTPASVELIGLELWTDAGSSQAPNNTRA